MGKRMLWTCAKCGGNEYSQQGKLKHICFDYKKTDQDRRTENKKEIEVAEVIEEKPQELTKKKGVKSGRKSKKTNKQLD